MNYENLRICELHGHKHRGWQTDFYTCLYLFLFNFKFSFQAVYCRHGQHRMKFVDSACKVTKRVPFPVRAVRNLRQFAKRTQITFGALAQCDLLTFGMC